MKLKKKHNKFFSVFWGSIIVTLLLLSIQATFKKPSKYVKPPEVLQETSLDFLQITFNEKQFEKINKKRNKALSVGVLETDNSDYVPALVSFNGKDFRAEVRLKGDWTDHLEGDKWSFRIKLKDDKTILGMRKFSIHHPRTRGNINEWLYHKAIKQESVIGLRYNFIEANIHVKIKGINKFITKKAGLYAVEETFDKRTIESNGRKESVILKFSEDYWWNEVKKSIQVGADYNKRWNVFLDPQMNNLKYSPITTFSEEKIMENPITKGYFELGKNMLEDLRSGNTTIDKVFDVKKLAMQNAILNLFGAVHGTYSINLRFYYNPITSLLEPMAFDGNSGAKSSRYEHFLFLDKKKDSVYLKALAKALNKVSSEDFIDQLLAGNLTEIRYYEKELKKEFSSKLFHETNIRNNQNILKQEMFRLKEKYQMEDVILQSKTSAIKEIPKIPQINKWVYKNTILTKQNEKFKNQLIYKITRKDKLNPSYVNIQNIKINFGATYRVTFKVKKNNSENSLFGLRIQGVYPNRADAIFNLDKGKIEGTNSIGYITNETAFIKPLANGWYECSIQAKANSGKISIIFGPTDKSKSKTGWEGKSDIISSVMITEPKLETN